MDIQILDYVDSGLYGQVYRGLQLSLNRPVAVKIIKTDIQNTADVLEHARLWSKASHPAVVMIHGVQDVAIPDIEEPVPAIIMEWLIGQKFANRLAGNRFSLEESLRISHDLIDGIEHLHSVGISHGDLHIGNIIVLQDCRAKIIDIDANKGASLARLSQHSHDGAIAADIDYCRGIISKTMRHSRLALRVLNDFEPRLEAASTLAEFRNVVEHLRLAREDSPNDGRSHTVLQSGTNSQPDWLTLPAKSGCDDDAVVRLLDTPSYFELLGIPYPADRAGVLERLEAEGLIKRSDGYWTISNIGAVLFARKLDEFGRLTRKAPRLIVYDGNSKINTKADYPGSKGFAVGFQPLVEFVNGLVPSNEVIEQALRREVKMFPAIAVRELVANAIIHQDFTETGMSVMIELYDDRMEISNPGEPFIPPERFIDAYKSRNEALADLMRRLKICEEKGSGVDKVIFAAEAFQLPAPDFRVGELRTSVVLFSHKELEQMDRKDRLRACYQHCCLRYVMNDRMTNQSLRERFKLDEGKIATVSSIIAATVEAGKIKPADPSQTSTRYRSYVPYWA